jgi:hypothetical protein
MSMLAIVMAELPPPPSSAKIFNPYILAPFATPTVLPPTVPD